MTGVFEFNIPAGFHDGRFAKEKTYHCQYKHVLLGCTMWCVWLTKKKKWSKWHVHYYFVGENETYSDFLLFERLVSYRTVLEISK